MKIKSNIESYNVKSLRGIDDCAKKMAERCEKLIDLASFLEGKIIKAREDGFEDVNTDKAEAEIKQFIEKLRVAESEYSELSASVNAYINKIDDIWSSWR